MTEEKQNNGLYTIKNGSIVLATEVSKAKISYVKAWFSAIYGI